MRQQYQSGGISVNFGNPITRGLLAAPLTHNLFLPDLLRNGWALNPAAGSGVPTIGAGPIGRGLVYTGTQYHKTPSPRTISTNATMACWFYSSNNSVGSSVIAMSPATGGNSRFQIMNNFGALIVGVQTAAGSSINTGNIINPLVIGKWYFVVARYNGTNIDGWCNGARQTAANAGTMAPVDLYIAARFNSTVGYWFSGGVAAPVWWNRALSDAEVADLINDPWQLYSISSKIILRPSAGGTAYNQSAGGTLTFSGAAIKAITKQLAGTMASSGAISKTTKKQTSGVITLAGLVSKQSKKMLSGTLYFVGGTAKLTGKAIAGILSFTGTLSGVVMRFILQAVGGMLSLSGSVTRQAQKTLTGTLSFTGGITRLIAKMTSGILSFAGVLTSLIPGAIAAVLGAIGIGQRSKEQKDGRPQNISASSRSAKISIGKRK